MIVHSLCNKCEQPFELILKAGDSNLLDQIADEGGNSCPCPRLCGGKINIVHDSIISDAVMKRISSVMALTGAELYQAVNGAGLPDENPKGVELVDSILRANPVVKCTLEVVEDRIYLHELHLSNGSIIHLTAGGRGAQVLKITKGTTT